VKSTIPLRFKSQLRPLSIPERLSPAARQRRKAEKEQERANWEAEQRKPRRARMRRCSNCGSEGYELEGGWCDMCRGVPREFRDD
jgi:hypothetical protein